MSDETELLGAQEDEDFDRSSFNFNLKRATKAVSSSEGAKETSINVAKLVGKAAFNAAVFVGKNAPGFLAEVLERQKEEVAMNKDKIRGNVEKVEKALRENPDLDAAKREKMEAYVARHK